MPKQVKFAPGCRAVRCEKNEQVALQPERGYDLLDLQPGKNGTVIVMVSDPNVKHVGGDDGKTPLPCTLRAQLPADQVVDA